MSLDVPIRDRKRGCPKHSWREHLPIVLHCIRKGMRRRNPVLTRIDLQVRDEVQFLPLCFAFRHLTDKPDNFRLPLPFFLSRYVNPVLEEIILRSIGAFSDTHLRILTDSTRHGFAPSRRNRRLGDTSTRCCGKSILRKHTSSRFLTLFGLETKIARWWENSYIGETTARATAFVNCESSLRSNFPFFTSFTSFTGTFLSRTSPGVGRIRGEKKNERRERIRI